MKYQKRKNQKDRRMERLGLLKLREKGFKK